jgi:hypothetical protein
MNASQQNRPAGLPSRRSITPVGFRNIRVLVPVDLHWRLSSYASQSKLTLPAFVLAILDHATPITPPTNLPCPSTPAANQRLSGPGPAADPRPLQALATAMGFGPGRAR